MESQLELLDTISSGVEKFKNELPDAMKFHDALNEQVYRDGVLSSKNKRLQALAIALRVGCPGCITYQTKLAIDAGATKAEIVETMAVAVAMGGTTTSAWTWMVVKLLEELGKW
jgi:AhpD family alkylhydroperoxidase